VADRDEFDRHLKKGWRAAGRHVLLHGVGDVSLRSVLRSLRKEGQGEGFPAFAEIVDVLIACSSVDPASIYANLSSLLDGIRKSSPCDSTGRLCEIAKRLHTNGLVNALCSDKELLRTEVGTWLLASFARSRFNSEPFLREVESKQSVSLGELHLRLDSLVVGLAERPELRKMSRALLDRPASSQFPHIRIYRPTISQAEILVFPLPM
jgi:hypothetical protein